MAIDNEAILRIFLTETEENFAAMEHSLVMLETSPSDKETLGTFFRMAHTLKGNTAAFGYTSLAETAHALEDLLDSLRAGRAVATPAVVTLMLETVDALRRMVPEATQGQTALGPQHEKLIRRLRDAAITGAQPKPDAPPRATSSASPPPEVASGRGGRVRTLRVEVDRLDRLLALTGEIGVARRRIEQMLAELPARGGERVLETHNDHDPLHLELQELVMKLRMVPVGPTFRQCVRIVRDASARTGKVARLVVQGENVEADTAVVDHLRDPLTHMVRNAVDHGIEAPELRKSAGKDPCGTVTLRAYHEAGTLVVQVADDGAGLNRERIRARARERGIPRVEALSDSELYELVFAPGFSTAMSVTQVSGRGVGLDVVRGSLEALRGTIAVDTTEGGGTTMTIRLPLTVAIIEGFAVGAAGETYLVPLAAVLECREIGTDGLVSGRRPSAGLADGDARELSGLINVRGAAVPYVRLRTLFGLGGGGASHESIVVVQYDGRKAGIAVDQLYGASTAVMQPLGSLFDGLPGLAGSTILGTGRVALILDVPSLFKHAIPHRQQQPDTRRTP